MLEQQETPKRRLSFVVQGTAGKFAFSFPENKRIEPNHNNPNDCVLALLRKIIKTCGEPVTVTATGRFLDQNEVIGFSALLKDNSISLLSLNNTGINGQGACALFEKLANNTQLVNLFLDGNHIDNAAMQSLSKALKANKKIAKITLSHNPDITSACVCNLGQAIRAHPSLKQLEINSLTEFDRIFLNQKIIENQKIKSGMSSNTPHQPFSLWRLLARSSEITEDTPLVDMHHH